jgi:hypothetical protein
MRHYESTVGRAGVRLQAEWRRKRENRRRRHGWELELAGFALYLGYGWDEVPGDGDCAWPPNRG